jgi:glycosyltransferase involved in cell wall biosynthesis
MTGRPLQILQVSTSDIGGGAEKIAWDLHKSYRTRGLGSSVAVGSKLSDDPDIFLIPLVSNFDRCSSWSRRWLTKANKYSSLVGKTRGAWKIRSFLRKFARPRLFLEIECGHEDFDFPGSWDILDLLGERPDILHCHNLHGGYFDLRALPWLSQEIPTILTLHDAWLLSGHCAHSFECRRWETGCGLCPDLTIPPEINRDATAYNWQRKKNIYAGSRLYVATPSQWLMRKVERSILFSTIVKARVIPNGINLADFHPSDQRKARAELGIPQNVKMLLFIGSTRSNSLKDYATLEAAVRLVAERLPTERVILICLGEKRQTQRLGQAEVQFIGFQNQPVTVARFYQAADLYLHAAKDDTFPNTVLEALACGTPVVATAVGGIPEQLKEGETGFLVPSKNAETMAERTAMLLTDESLRHQFGLNATQDARVRFDLNHQVDSYVDWYDTIADRRSGGA